jgi:hypothetical protein
LRSFAETAKAAPIIITRPGFTNVKETIMAENFRQGDRVEWHNSPQMTSDPQDLKRAKFEHGSGSEHSPTDDAGEGAIPNDHR